MVLTNITDAEKRRFKDLQSDGMLPSQALKKIETERRLGIIPEDKPPGRFSITKENWWFYTAMGAIGIGILYLYMKSPSPTQSQTQIQTKTVSLPVDNSEDAEYEYLYEIDSEDY